MKKILSVILLVTMLFSVTASFAKEDAYKEKTATFTTVRIPFPNDIEEFKSWLTVARYKDTKEAITLSEYYDGYVYATVPTKNKDREIEAFVPEELSFTDIDNTNPDFHDVMMLSQTGVIKGNDKGEARIYDTVTRAEATAMVMRFLGLDSMPEANAIVNFDDVLKDDWFYMTVMSAYYCGIIKGDSETTFSPYRNVTREEITVMVARALQYADLRCPAVDIAYIVDEDKISDWAADSYDYIGSSLILDYDNENQDWENPTYYLNPQMSATRANVAFILNNTGNICQLYSSDLAVYYGFDKEMPTIDGSTSTYPITTTVYSSLFQNAYTHKQFPRRHSKSHASYERLINGEVDMLFASVYPASDILALAEEKGVELELIPIAYDAMIFFTNADNPATGLTTEQITNIYVNNAYENWSQIGGPDALLYPYCRNNDSGSHAQMERHFLNGNEIHPEVQKETSTTMSNVLTDVMAAQTDNPTGYGLGYSIYYYFHNMDLFYSTSTELKILAIDGVMPTDETISNGSYPLSNNTYIVLRKDSPEGSPARKMAEFMLTDAGQQCVQDAGYGRLKPSTEISGDLTFSDKLNTQMPSDKNYMFSPISVKMALALAANGAKSETKDEIMKALGLSDLDEFNQMSKDLIERYSKTNILSLNIANSIWINKDKTAQNFSNEFKNIATKYYEADVKSVNNIGAVKEINSWVSDKTNGKISQIIQNTDDFWAMLVNAIYFKGAWENEFNLSATRPDEFTSADGTKTQSDFMNKTGWLSYAKTKSAQIIELPYKNRIDKISADGEYLGTEKYDDLDVSMYLIAADGNINAWQELNAAISDEIFEHTYIKLSVPKFKIEFETSLSDILKNLGITKGFDKDTADFTDMFDDGNMWITQTLHKTYISVDEKGTEAAAVTAIGMAGSAMPPEPLELKFNKPFYFVIRDNTSGEALFMGRYAFAK